MKGLSKFFSLALFVSSLLAACAPARAQSTNNVLLVVFHDSSAVPVNGSIFYQFIVTNLAGGPLVNSVLTNEFSAPVDILSATNDHAGSITTNGNTLTFFVTQNIVGFGGIARFGVTVRPTTPGTLTNSITFDASNLVNPIVPTNSVINDVTNVPGLDADVGVDISTPPGPFYPNDWITYSLIVTNLGPNTATNVVLTNGLSGVTFQSASPKQTSRSGTNVVFNVGSITNGDFRIFNVTVQAPAATNTASTNSISAFVKAIGNTDANSANDSASADLIVVPFLTNQLVASTLINTQTFNPQIGLMEQGILLSNTSPSAVPSARVVVAGIRNTDRLFNAVGTNDGLPFVELPTTLGGNESVAMMLQFFVPSHAQFSPNLTAQALSAPVDLTPPPNLIPVTNTPNGYTRIANLGSKMLIEFPSTNGASYAIVYSDDMTFTTSRVARPFIVAPANWTYWYDYGPPNTISAPTNSSARFYKVFQVPK